MIARDQPRCFDHTVLVAFSSKDDGTILDRSAGIHSDSAVTNRNALCTSIGIDYDSAVFQRIVYSDSATYSLIAEVDSRSTTRTTSEIVADALYTETAQVGLFLPVADCIATVVHDPVRGALAVLHLGRHSTLTDLIQKTVSCFVLRGSTASDLIVWMSPSAQKQSYSLDYFEPIDSPEWQDYAMRRGEKIFLDMQGHNRAVFLTAGLIAENINVSSVNTMTSPDYFSHAAGDTHGRQAVIAMLR